MTNPTSLLRPQNGYSSTLSAPVTTSDTTIYINTLPTASEGYLTIDEGLTTQEVFFYNSKGSNFVTVPTLADRGLQGSTSGVSAHSSGASVKMKTVAQYLAAVADGYALGSTAVNSNKVDWTTTGGIWWQELGRTTLGASATTFSVTFTPKKRLRLIGYFYPGAAALDIYLRFNSDIGNNYAWHYNNTTGAAPTDTTSTSSLVFTRSANAQVKMVTADIVNIANQSKIMNANATEIATTAAGAPYLAIITGGWYNTSTQISTINVIETAATANCFAAGSELIVLGHD